MKNFIISRHGAFSISARQKKKLHNFLIFLKNLNNKKISIPFNPGQKKLFRHRAISLCSNNKILAFLLQNIDYYEYA